MTLLERIAREISFDFGGGGVVDTTHLRWAQNVIDAITKWAAENLTEAAPWEEHFRGTYGEVWEYQFQHKVPHTVLVSEEEAAWLDAGIDPNEAQA